MFVALNESTWPADALGQSYDTDWASAGYLRSDFGHGRVCSSLGGGCRIHRRRLHDHAEQQRYHATVNVAGIQNTTTSTTMRFPRVRSLVLANPYSGGPSQGTRCGQLSSDRSVHVLATAARRRMRLDHGQDTLTLATPWRVHPVLLLIEHTA